MGHEAGTLHREDEPVRRLVVPAPERVGPLQAVERAVDLDGGQVRGEVFQFAPVRQLGWIEDEAKEIWRAVCAEFEMPAQLR